MEGRRFRRAQAGLAAAIAAALLLLMHPVAALALTPDEQFLVLQFHAARTAAEIQALSMGGFRATSPSGTIAYDATTGRASRTVDAGRLVWGTRHRLWVPLDVDRPRTTAALTILGRPDGAYTRAGAQAERAAELAGLRWDSPEDAVAAVLTPATRIEHITAAADAQGLTTYTVTQVTDRESTDCRYTFSGASLQEIGCVGKPEAAVRFTYGPQPIALPGRGETVATPLLTEARDWAKARVWPERIARAVAHDARGLLRHDRRHPVRAVAAVAGRHLAATLTTEPVRMIATDHGVRFIAASRFGRSSWSVRWLPAAGRIVPTRLS